MKNVNKLLVVLLSVVFISSGIFAQSDLSPKLKNQLEVKVKTPAGDNLTTGDIVNSSSASPMQAPTKKELENARLETTKGLMPGIKGMEVASNSNTIPYNSEAIFDLQFDFPVGIGGGEAGIETDGNYIYTSMWNGAGDFQRYGIDGTWIETINLPGASGCRDMAFNGTYFYGGAASTTIFEMDLANATMISTFTGPADCRAIAYDDEDNTFYCNNWSSDITKFDNTGANLGSFAVGTSAASYYGFAFQGAAYCGDGPFLWGYSQTGATSNELIQMDLPSGNETGVTFDVGSVANVGAGIAGGMAISADLFTGYWTILGTSQNEDIWGLELCTSGPAATNDVGVMAITSPSSGVGLTSSETVTVTVKNYGTAPQGNFDVWFTLDGGTPVVETITATINGGDTYSHTFGTTVDLSAFGIYAFEACTDLTGDENPVNDCASKNVENAEPSLCAPVYSTGCSFGDGFTDFAVEQIQNLGTGCEDNMGTGWSQYFGLGPAILFPGVEHIFQMGTGYSSQHVNIWIDFNDDLLLTADEMIIQDYIMVDAGVLYDVPITIPANATAGLHVMRAMTVWLNAFDDPCGSYSYGEAEDYMVNIGVAEYGILEGYVTENTGGAPISGAAISVSNGGWTATSGADGYYQILDVLVGDWPVDCTADGYNPASATVTITNGGTTQQDFPMTTPTLDISPLSIDVIIDPFAQTTENLNIANNGDGSLDWNAQIEFLTDNGISDFIKGSQAYAFDLSSSSVVSLDVDLPGTLTTIGGTAVQPFAGDFDATNTSFFYVIDYTTGNFYTVDVSTGAETLIGPVTGMTAGHNMSGMACDKSTGIMYASSTDVTNSDIYTVDLTSGALTLIGTTGIPGLIEIVIDGTGTMYGWDIVNDESFTIDKSTGASTLLGSLGFDLNYAQGGNWDPTSDVIYVAAYSSLGQLMTLDKTTGAFNLVGDFPAGDEVDCLAFPGGSSNWLSITPQSGTLAAGTNEDMAVNFDATDIVAGTVKTANLHFFSNPEVGTVTVPVTMTVGNLDFGYVNGNVFLDGVSPYNIGDVTEVLVEVGPYPGYPDSNGDYSIQTYPGTYDVTATLYGYQTQTATGIVVTENGTVTQDFTMPCLYGEVSGTVTETDGGAPIPGATVDLVGTDFEATTAADGTYSIIVEAGTYDVHVHVSGFGQQTATGVVISAQATTTQDFQLDVLAGIIVVIDLDPTPNPQITDVIQGFFPGGLVEYTTTIDGYPLDEEVQTVFLLLGIYSSNYTLTDADAAVITSWIDGFDNRNLYMEGGDTWAFDAATALHGYFNINGLADGTGDLATVDGIAGLWDQFNWSYIGENNWIDHLEAIPPAINVCENPDIGYYNCVAYDAGTYRTVGASYEVTGLVDGNGSFDMGIASIMGFFGYPVFTYGDLEGYVTESGTGNPIQDALVSVNGEEGLSGADGYYLVSGILVGDWTATCTKTGYNPQSAPVTITDGGLTVQDFVLTAPEFNVTPTTIDVTLQPNELATEVATISNPGTGDVDWAAAISIIGDSPDAMFDVLMDVPVGVGGGEAGIETDGNFIYTSMWNGAGEFQRYNMDGIWVETISIPSAAGCRDIAYDGTYFYGGAASTTIFEMDLANATMISTFTGPAACRAVAYNENDDAFYCNNWSDDITKFDKAGANLGSFAVGASAASYYGFAYDGYSDGNPFLWGYSQTGATSNELIQMELPSGTETGLTFDVGSVTNVGAGIAGGLAIDEHISPTGLYAFLGTSQNENIWALELGGAAGPVWLTIDPNSGTLLSGGSEPMDVNFDATGLLPGIYEATINFSTTPDVGSPTIDVTLTVEGLIPAVNLDATANCTDVDLTWEMPTGGNPDSWNVYKDGTLLANATEMLYTDAMVDPEVEYCYEVTAVYGAEESFPTPEYCITVATPDNLEPLDPTAVHLGGGDVQVSWSAPTACVAPDSYNIYRDGSMVGSSTTLSYLDNALSAGFYEYYVVAVYYFGESGNSLPAYVLVGVNDLAASQFQIFPNPAKDMLTVRSDYHINSLEVLNNVGQVVIVKDVESNNFQINVSQYERGIYYIKLITDDGTVLRKIAVE